MARFEAEADRRYMRMRQTTWPVKPIVVCTFFPFTSIALKSLVGPFL